MLQRPLQPLGKLGQALRSPPVAWSTWSQHRRSDHQRPRRTRGYSADDVAPPTQQLAGTGKDSVLQQLDQLRRQLETAVAQEDYSRAQQLKQQADALKGQLSPVQQYVQHQLQKLETGTTAEKAEAIKGLGEVGDEECFPALAACLSDPELCEAAHAALWRTFMRHPNPDVQILMQQGVGFMEHNNLPLALEAFDAACKLEPSFAEAHNKRATVLYLMKQYRESIAVCELVLELNPYHFGAASGMGMCYIGLAEYKEALHAFERTLQIHPGLDHIAHFISALRDQLPGETGAS